MKDKVLLKGLVYIEAVTPAKAGVQ